MSTRTALNDEDPTRFDAGTLQLGPLFGNPEKAVALSNSEAYFILNERKNAMREEEVALSDMFTKTQHYLVNHKANAEQGAVEELRKTLVEFETGGRRLHSFEIAMLINLQPADFDEATTLIPSLGVFENVVVERILEEVQRAIPL